MEVKITVDVYCERPLAKPAYRVYFDDELMTERSYIWDNGSTTLNELNLVKKQLVSRTISGQAIRERMIVEATPGQHTVRIEPVNPRFEWFHAKNITVNGNPVSGSTFTV